MQAVPVTQVNGADPEPLTPCVCAVTLLRGVPNGAFVGRRGVTQTGLEHGVDELCRHHPAVSDECGEGIAGGGAKSDPVPAIQVTAQPDHATGRRVLLLARA